MTVKSSRGALLLGLMLCVSTTGCGATRSSHHFDSMTTALQAFFRVFLINQHGTKFAQTGSAAIEEAADCHVSGRVEAHDDGRLVFHDCEMSKGAVMNGALLSNDSGSFYENFTLSRDGRLHKMDGSYKWESEGVLVIDLDLTYPDFDDGPDVHAKATGRMTISDDKVSGSYGMITDKDKAAGRPGSSCTFDKVTVVKLAEFVDSSDTFPPFCEDNWVLTPDCEGAARHLCERMPSQGCNTATMDNAVNKVISACDMDFSISGAQRYCSVTAKTAYSIDACLKSGT